MLLHYYSDKHEDMLVVVFKYRYELVKHNVQFVGEREHELHFESHWPQIPPIVLLDVR